MKKGRFEDAEKFLILSLTYFTEEESKKHPRYAMAYQVYATYLLAVKDYEKSIGYAYKATETFDKMGLLRDAADSLQVAVDAHAELGRVNEAFESQRKVSDLLRIQRQLTNRERF